MMNMVPCRQHQLNQMKEAEEALLPQNQIVSGNGPAVHNMAPEGDHAAEEVEESDEALLPQNKIISGKGPELPDSKFKHPRNLLSKLKTK
ncbi:unnamed protein product [Orchesella dallaii]|uniref:Uncharacterized protein n=1 Tax=Orchesella dallaii TaxID=48710 RepID=A0ABP1Q7R5_9HEXA